MSDGNDKRFVQFAMGNAAWSSEKEKELLSLRKQNKSLQESMVTLLEAKLEKENKNSKLITKLEQLERDFMKKAKEVDSLKDEQVTTEGKLDKLQSRDKRRNKIPTQADYEAHILRLRQERDSLAHQLNHANSYIEHIHFDFKKLQKQLKTFEIQKHDLENTHNKTMKDLVHNQKEAIIVTLKEDVKRLQSERDDKDKQIADLKADKDELQSKLGKVAGEKMLDKNPQLADLSDPRRPQKLVEMISILYDNKWTDAFEKSEDKGDEKQICVYLLDIFKECWNYCKETCEQQTKILEQNLLLASENKDALYALSPGSSTLLTEIRKRSAKEMMPNLYEKFKSVKQDIKEDVHTYVESCLEVCWYSAINEPPMHYGFDAEEQADDFGEYTQGGNTVDFVVWPAMYLFMNGPILYKGVAQYKK